VPKLRQVLAKAVLNSCNIDLVKINQVSGVLLR